jgi:hypothetical protein
LKKIFYIFILIFTLSNTSFAQSRTALDPSNVPSKFIKFYPNPATAVINFDFQKGYNSNYSLLIFNFMGKKIYELKNTPSRININLEDFYRGIYIYQLRNQNGAVLESGKFQVVK